MKCYNSRFKKVELKKQQQQQRVDVSIGPFRLSGLKRKKKKGWSIRNGGYEISETPSSTATLTFGNSRMRRENGEVEIFKNTVGENCSYPYREI